MVDAQSVFLQEVKIIQSTNQFLIKTSVTYMTPSIIVFRRQRGQSLVEYLMSNQSGKSGPELDRENAHFSVSEAMIAAIEEV